MKDFYVAGPFFSDEQIASMERLESILTKHNCTMFRPRFDAGQVDMKNSSSADMDKVFENDIKGVTNAKYIIANLTYKDTGTSFELGYAKASGIPIILFNEQKISGRQVNLMLARTSEFYFNSVEELDEWFENGTYVSTSEKIDNCVIDVE